MTTYIVPVPYKAFFIHFWFFYCISFQQGLTIKARAGRVRIPNPLPLEDFSHLGNLTSAGKRCLFDFEIAIQFWSRIISVIFTEISNFCHFVGGDIKYQYFPKILLDLIFCRGWYQTSVLFQHTFRFDILKGVISNISIFPKYF